MTDPKELQALLDVARSAGYSPSDVDPVNPYKVKGPKGDALKIAAEATNPQMAAKWKAESLKFPDTLETAALRAGIGEMSQTAHRHLMETDSDYMTSFEESQARREAGWAADWEQKASEMAAKRNQQQLRRASRGPSLSVSQHCNDFNRLWGRRQNEPASRLVK